MAWSDKTQLRKFLEETNLLSYESALLQQGVDDVNRLRQMEDGEFQQLCSVIGMASNPFHLQQLAHSLGRHTPMATLSISAGSAMPATCTPNPTHSTTLLPVSPHLQQQPPVAMLYRPFTTSSIPTALSHSSSTRHPSSPFPSFSSSPSTVATAYMMPTVTFQQHSPSLLPKQPSPSAQPFQHQASSSLASSETASLHTHSVSRAPPSFQPYVTVSTVGVRQEQTNKDPQVSTPSTGQSVSAVASALTSPRASNLDRKIFLPPYLRPESESRNFDELVDSQTPVQSELGPPPFTPSTWDPKRAELIRKHSGIYGQNTNKRKTGELSPHEENVNEAAFQLCLRDPTLLVRRDELFILARRAVKKGGYIYTHHHKGKGSESGQHIAGTKRLSSSKSVDDAEEEEDETPLEGEPEPKKLLREKRVERLGELETLIADNKQEQSVKLAALERARQSSDFALAYQLQLEVETLGNECHQLQAEFSVLKKNQRRSEKYFESKAKGREEQKGTESTGQDVTSNFCAAHSREKCTSDAVYTSTSVATHMGSSAPAMCPEHEAAALEFERRNAPIFPTKVPSKQSRLLSSLPFNQQGHHSQQQNHSLGTSSPAAFNPFHH